MYFLRKSGTKYLFVLDSCQIHDHQTLKNLSKPRQTDYIRFLFTPKLPKRYLNSSFIKACKNVNHYLLIITFSDHYQDTNKEQQVLFCSDCSKIQKLTFGNFLYLSYWTLGHGLVTDSDTNFKVFNESPDTGTDSDNPPF